MLIITITTCDEVCGKTRGKSIHGGTWWWNDQVKEAIARKKDAYKELCKNGTDENKARYKNMKNRAKKMVAKAMKEEVEKGLREVWKMMKL